MRATAIGETMMKNELRHFNSKDAFERRLSAVRLRVRPCTRPYRPSGRIPLSAWPAMLAGAVAGVVTGAPAGLVVMALGVYVGNEVVEGIWREARKGDIYIGRTLLMAFMGFVTFGLGYVLVGQVAARTVFAAGKLRKNRNATVAAAFGLLSALGAGAVLRWPVASWVLARVEMFSVVDTIVRQVFGSGPHGWVFTVIGFLIAGAMGFLAARWLVVHVAFCEECSTFMKTRRVRELSIAEGVALAGACKLHDAARPLQIEWQPASEGHVDADLSRCPSCQRGYLELTVRFEATVSADGKRRKNWASWGAGPWPLTAKQTACLHEHADALRQRGKKRT